MSYYKAFGVQCSCGDALLQKFVSHLHISKWRTFFKKATIQYKEILYFAKKLQASVLYISRILLLNVSKGKPC